LRGWNVDSCIVATGTKIYETGFGYLSLPKPQTEFGAFRVRLSLKLDALALFWNYSWVCSSLS
jgi:hypothetical protein